MTAPACSPRLARRACLSCLDERRLRADCDGSTLAEFAISAGLLLTVIVGIMVFALELFASHFVVQAANAAARYSMVRGSSWSSSCASATTTGCNATGTNITAYVKSIMPSGLSASSLQVKTVWPGTTPAGYTCANTGGNNSPGCLVKVTVSYKYSYLFPVAGASSTMLTSTAAQTIAQ